MWLVEQDAVDGIGAQQALDLAEEPLAERLVIEAGDFMIATVTIQHARMWMAKGVPAWHQEWPGKQIPVTAQADMRLESDILGQEQPAFQVARPAQIFLLVKGKDDIACARCANLLEITFDHVGV